MRIREKNNETQYIFARRIPQNCCTCLCRGSNNVFHGKFYIFKLLDSIHIQLKQELTLESFFKNKCQFFWKNFRVCVGLDNVSEEGMVIFKHSSMWYILLWYTL